MYSLKRIRFSIKAFEIKLFVDFFKAWNYV
jgi:hypothetical protein